MREQLLVGRDYLEAVTELLQRARRAHPTKGLYEAGDLQWWWRVPRPTDELDQLFWLDDDGRPAAAVIVTEWREHVALDPMVLPDVTPDWVAHVVARGLVQAGASGFDAVELEVDRADDVLRNVLVGHDFIAKAEGFVVESWLDADARPEISSLHDGYRLFSRAETTQHPHHMISTERNHPDPEPRLRQTSLYRPDLDLVVHDRDGTAAAYGLFWYDPETATGLVEPMRTEDRHQRRGLARHVLTAGVDRLATLGAERIKICYEPDNPASGHLYRSVGFVPVKETDTFSGNVGARTL